MGQCRLSQVNRIERNEKNHYSQTMQLLTPGVGLIIWQIIIFTLLLILLAKLAWKPIMSSLKEREMSIQEALDTAEKARHEMSQLKADNEKLLAEAREEPRLEERLHDAQPDGLLQLGHPDHVRETDHARGGYWATS